MNRIMNIVAASCVLATFLAGCKKESGTTEPPIVNPPGTINEVEPNNTTAQSLGALGATDINVAGSASGVTDIDLFSVQLTGATNFFVSVSWTGGSDLDFEIMNSANININAQAGTANPERCTLSSLAAGTYVVKVSTKSTATTQYLLTVGKR